MDIEQYPMDINRLLSMFNDHWSFIIDDLRSLMQIKIIFFPLEMQEVRGNVEFSLKRRIFPPKKKLLRKVSFNTR